MSELPFVQILLESFSDPSISALPPSYRCVLYRIFSLVCFSPCKQDDHGVLIELLPGQMMCTIRQLADLANVGKNDAERALKKFVELQIVRQEVRHKKTILTVLWGIKLNDSETTKETRKRQERDTKEYINTKKKNLNHDLIDAREPEFFDLEFDHKKIGKIRALKSDIVEKFKIDGLTEKEILFAIAKMQKQNPSLNGSIESYIKSILKNEKQSKGDKCKNSPLKKKIEEFPRDKGFYLDSDTSEAPLAKYARQTGHKKAL